MVEEPSLDATSALQTAQEVFILRGKTGGTPITKFELQHFEEFKQNFKQKERVETKHFRKRKTVDGKVV